MLALEFAPSWKLSAANPLIIRLHVTKERHVARTRGAPTIVLSMFVTSLTGSSRRSYATERCFHVNTSSVKQRCRSFALAAGLPSHDVVVRNAKERLVTASLLYERL